MNHFTSTVVVVTAASNSKVLLFSVLLNPGSPQSNKEVCSAALSLSRQASSTQWIQFEKDRTKRTLGLKNECVRVSSMVSNHHEEQRKDNTTPIDQRHCESENAD